MSPDMGTLRAACHHGHHTLAGPPGFQCAGWGPTEASTAHLGQGAGLPPGWPFGAWGSCPGYSRDRGLVAGWAVKGSAGWSERWVKFGCWPGLCSLVPCKVHFPGCWETLLIGAVPHLPPRKPPHQAALWGPVHSGLGHSTGPVTCVWGGGHSRGRIVRNPPKQLASAPPPPMQMPTVSSSAVLVSGVDGAFHPGPHLLCGSCPWCF